MKKETAILINAYLNSPNAVNALTVYVNERTSQLQALLKVADNIDDVRRHQGAIVEIEKLLKLRNDSIAVLEVD